MIFRIESIVEQVTFGEKYKGSLKVDGKEFRYIVTFESKASRPEVKKFSVTVNLFNRRWEGLNLQENIGGMLKHRIAEDVMEFYSKLDQFKINDDSLLGGIAPCDEVTKQYEVIESKISRRESYGLRLDPSCSIRPKEIKKFLDDYVQ